jgi:hypothetical protein
LLLPKKKLSTSRGSIESVILLRVHIETFGSMGSVSFLGPNQLYICLPWNLSSVLSCVVQCAKQHRLQVQHPVPKLDEGDEVTEEILLTSLKHVVSQHSALQAENGHWPGDFGGLMFIMPILVYYCNLKLTVFIHLHR